MVGLAVQIELAIVVAVQCPHDADARHHRRAVVFRDQDLGGVPWRPATPRPDARPSAIS